MRAHACRIERRSVAASFPLEGCCRPALALAARIHDEASGDSSCSDVVGGELEQPQAPPKHKRDGPLRIFVMLAVSARMWSALPGGGGLAALAAMHVWRKDGGCQAAHSERFGSLIKQWRGWSKAPLLVMFAPQIAQSAIRGLCACLHSFLATARAVRDSTRLRATTHRGET